MVDRENEDHVEDSFLPTADERFKQNQTKSKC